jgi:hypothetical protein
MNLLNIFRRVGWLLFAFMWIPFICIFVGMAPEMGGIGRDFARKVEGVIPGMFDIQPWGASWLTTIAMVLTFGLMFAAMAFLFGTPILAGFRNRRVLRNGRTGEGRILSVAQTGVYINNNPMMRITLEVTPLDGRPFEAETERLISIAQIPQFQPGAVVPVRYDPNTQEVAIGEAPTQ